MSDRGVRPSLLKIELFYKCTNRLIKDNWNMNRKEIDMNKK